MIAIVDKNETAILDISPEMVPFLRRKFNQLVTAQIAEWAFKYFIAVELNYFFLLVDGYGGVLDQRMQQVGRHPLVCIPISRSVLKSCKEKWFHASLSTHQPKPRRKVMKM